MHSGKSAADLSMELRDHMTGYIGPGGAVKDRITSGEHVVVLQLLYNKLVDMGKISGSEIKVDGDYGAKTGNAIYKIRELAGGGYPGGKLKNKGIEKSLDSHTVDNLVKLLAFPTMKPVREVPKDVEERFDVLNRDLDFLDTRLETPLGTESFKSAIDTDSVRSEIDALRERFMKGDQNVVNELAYMQIEVSNMHYALSALNALAAMKVNTNIEKYLTILGPEKVKTLKNALAKGYELESSSDQPNQKLLSAYSENIHLLGSWLKVHPSI